LPALLHIWKINVTTFLKEILHRQPHKEVILISIITNKKKIYCTAYNSKSVVAAIFPELAVVHYMQLTSMDWITRV
jgi:hypothetical protein